MTKKSTNGARHSSPKSNNPRKAEMQDTGAGMESSQLEKLFEDELKDIYWAEKALTKAIPKMIKKSTSQKLIEAFEHHLSETNGQIARLETVFNLINKKAVAKKCEAMAGLIKEAEELMKEADEGAMRDAAIISAAQKIEHYEIASYGTLRTFAEVLNLPTCAQLLEETLLEEKGADLTLTEVAETRINEKAAHEMAD